MKYDSWKVLWSPGPMLGLSYSQARPYLIHAVGTATPKQSLHYTSPNNVSYHSRILKFSVNLHIFLFSVYSSNSR